MKVGLMGFGKTGKAVASVLLQDKPKGLYTMEDLLMPYFQFDAGLPERLR